MRNTFTGTATVQPDGSRVLAAEGHPGRRGALPRRLGPVRVERDRRARIDARRRTFERQGRLLSDDAGRRLAPSHEQPGNRSEGRAP